MPSPHDDTDFDTDHEHEHDDDPNIDPALRLRTVRTAASTIAESIRYEQRQERRKSVRRKRSLFFRKDKEKKHHAKAPPDEPGAAAAAGQIAGQRRNVYVNMPLAQDEVDRHGEPIVQYPRNKVRTTRYTLLTFVPKNLLEQFCRIANIYFLALIIFQLFPIFGSVSPQTAALPLLFIIVVTGIKDGLEDFRRAQVDEELNTSAATHLGNWRNVNQPRDPRPWYERALGLHAPGKVTRGVRKLREKEAGEAGTRVMLTRAGEGGPVSEEPESFSDSSMSLHHGTPGRGDGNGNGRVRGPGGRHLEDIQSVDSHSYPPPVVAAAAAAAAAAANGKGHVPDGSMSTTMSSDELGRWGADNPSLSAYAQSVAARSSMGVLDWKKHISGSARWERTLWKKLEVGDVVLLRDGEQIPADVVVLSCSDADGTCFVETKNLDGETNLKPRKALRATQDVQSEEDVERCSFVLDSEPPHQNLYLYNGVLRYRDLSTGAEKKEGVTINELLLRGCTVRNTAWIIGLVVFTGPDTKIYLNGGLTPSKRSKIEKETNYNVVVNFVLLVIMCTVSAVINGVWDGATATSVNIYEQGVNPTDSAVLNALVTFVSCLIAFQNIVPVSLFISIEIVKTIQAYFIGQDMDMYSSEFDAACVPKNWGISDDLGQIEYIFSDKTGTLTQNVMEFQKCSIAGTVYGEGVTEAQRGAAQRQGRANDPSMDPEEMGRRLVQLKDEMVTGLRKAFKNRYMQPDRLTLVAPQLADDIADRSSARAQAIIAFFRALALCHSVLAERPEPKEEPNRLEYKAESPDEAALVAAARDVGFPFVGKSKDALDIEVLGQAERYTHLKTLEFSSARKRMSVVVRCPDGRLVLYCKGADSVIYERLAADADEALKVQTSKDMDAFANGGLRTLCIAYRVLGEEEFLSWSRAYDAAAAAVENRDEEMEKAAAVIERDLHILGATALEDKLQVGVPEAIETLHRAGIKLWILTGDKLQTAIEIGFSCNLLKPDMEIMILSADNADAARAQIEAALNKMASVLGPPSFDAKHRGFVPGAQAAFATVIDGDTLRYALEPALKPLFLALGTQCETVVCCRVSPAQKALTVKLVKEGRKAMTLSIGDGANDVAMIQEANVGCGLLGHEGSQAAMSADYAFGQFRFLTRLLLVHGRWSYQRIADLHTNFFYKTVMWTFAMFWFLPFCYFDATYLYDYSFILLYNLLFTSLPVIVLGAFDQDVNAKAALAFPQLYVRGIRGLEYTRAKFWMYMFDGLYQSAIVFFIPYLVWTLDLGTGPGAVSWNGRDIQSLTDFGTTVAITAVLTANCYVGMNTNYWTFITWIVIICSSLVMMVWVVVYSFLPPDNFFSETGAFVDEVQNLFSNVTFWSTVVFSTLVALAPRFIIKFVVSGYMPLDKDIVREAWVGGDLKDQLGIAHRKASKNKTRADLEQAPMFSRPHARSASEATLQQAYEPTRTTDSLDYVKPQRTAMPSTVPSTAGMYDEDDHLAPPPMTPHSGLSPGSPGSGRGYVSPASPNPSYYSASAIPSPSPVPPALYKYPSGEVTGSRVPLRSPGARSPSVSPNPESRTTSPGYRDAPNLGQGHRPREESYEMQVRHSPYGGLSPYPSFSPSPSGSPSGSPRILPQQVLQPQQTYSQQQSPYPPQTHQPYPHQLQPQQQQWGDGSSLAPSYHSHVSPMHSPPHQPLQQLSPHSHSNPPSRQNSGDRGLMPEPEDPRPESAMSWNGGMAL
ncbi:phospholipid-translocating P-type ATPase [Coniophora puteana RWD-64-598 SS2]|uniref:Phospholipid-transporting ATPase n=1 Tax=Coniophora puteana (strain RWD-64-598) TaxID=741705 RepID=A0A5M3M8I8_CONPW|nr:phospholipid-translocating P-type ATPase [Coniophora puteana RWD-64-598 SS2]EIW75489.1 phospholipid-translocating P-type ATPase [Coniophora puteana RWD-64-598 SS2]